MGELGHAKAASMNELKALKALGSEDATARTTETDIAEAMDRVTNAAAKRGRRQTLEAVHRGPEALAGWLADQGRQGAARKLSG